MQDSPWPGIIKLFPARESLVSDIPARDAKTANLFNIAAAKQSFRKELL